MIDATLKLNEMEVVDHEQKVLDTYQGFWHPPEDLTEEEFDEKFEETSTLFHDLLKRHVGEAWQNDEGIEEFVSKSVFEGICDFEYRLEKILREIVSEAVEDACCADPQTLEIVLDEGKVDDKVYNRINVVRLVLATYMYYYIVKRLGVAIDKYDDETGKYLVLKLTSESPELEKVFSFVIGSVNRVIRKFESAKTSK
jgi:hypothetical protein